MRRCSENADGTEVELSIGDVVDICLDENPTTGFRWNLKSSGESVCTLVKEYFSHEGASPGSGGIHHWNFKAVAAGTSMIELTYARPWQKGPPARTFKLRIRADG
jgi:inhibitor of cysteine peptidase